MIIICENLRIKKFAFFWAPWLKTKKATESVYSMALWVLLFLLLYSEKANRIPPQPRQLVAMLLSECAE